MLLSVVSRTPSGFSRRMIFDEAGGTVTPSYLRIVQRSLDAADAVLAQALQEKAGFLAYHGFESLGGALCSRRGIPYPRSHPGKLRQFVAASKQDRFGFAAAQLMIELIALRNMLLYPEQLPGKVRRPEEIITVAQARRLVGRVRTLSRQVQRAL